MSYAATYIKPRIRIWCGVWRCLTATACGWGNTPAQAYAEWQQDFNLLDRN